MNQIKQVRTLLIQIAVVALTLRLILWCIEPFIPFIFGAIAAVSVFIFVFGLLLKRSSKL